MTATILPDCTLCGGHVRADFDGTTPIEVCQRCGATNRPITRKPTWKDRAEVREHVATVVEARPVLCDPCVVKRCTSCVTAGCDCPRQRHPRRPAGSWAAEGLALLAGETPGHLEPAELTGGTR